MPQAPAAPSPRRLPAARSRSLRARSMPPAAAPHPAAPQGPGPRLRPERRGAAPRPQREASGRRFPTSPAESPAGQPRGPAAGGARPERRGPPPALPRAPPPPRGTAVTPRAPRPARVSQQRCHNARASRLPAAAALPWDPRPPPPAPGRCRGALGPGSGGCRGRGTRSPQQQPRVCGRHSRAREAERPQPQAAEPSPAGRGGCCLSAALLLRLLPRHRPRSPQPAVPSGT